MLDYVIQGGTVIDGRGARSRADVGIRDGRIVAVGEVADPADRTRRLGSDRDTRLHRPAHALRRPAVLGRLGHALNVHGVTTVIGGNCGFTLAPMKRTPTTPSG